MNSLHRITATAVGQSELRKAADNLLIPRTAIAEGYKPVLIDIQEVLP